MSETTHECQCQEHDCRAEVSCVMPGRCGRPEAAEHRCGACQDCGGHEGEMTR